MITRFEKLTFQNLTPEQRRDALARRYWVFAGIELYPMGGLDDLIATCDKEKEAEVLADPWTTDRKWFRVYDTKTGGVASEC